MKQLLIVILVMASSLTFSFEEYLYCFGQHDSTWGGYNVSLKKLPSGRVIGVLKKYSILKKDSYTPIFDVIVKNNPNQTSTYSNKEQGINFTTYKDNYSGSLLGEAFSDSYIYPSELLCEEMNAEYFY